MNVPAVGTVLGRFDDVVDRARVWRVDWSCGLDVVEYQDPEVARAGGAPHIFVPPGALVFFSFLAGDAWLGAAGVAFDRSLAVGRRIRFHQPLHVGDPVTGEPTVTSVVTRDRGDSSTVLVTISTHYESGGAVAVEEDVTYLTRHDTGEAHEPGEAHKHPGDAAHTPAPAGPPRATDGRDGRDAAGAPPAFVTLPLDRTRIEQFALAMRDSNPVHHDDGFCRALGLPGIIAPAGMAVVAMAHAAVRRYGLGAVREIDVRFRSPMPAGERLACRLELTGHGDRDGHDRHDRGGANGHGPVLRVRAEGRGGAVRAAGTVTVARPPEAPAAGRAATQGVPA